MDFSQSLELQGQLFRFACSRPVAAKGRLFSETAKTLLTDLVLYVTLPCSIILFIPDGNQGRAAWFLVHHLPISIGVQVICYLLTASRFSRWILPANVLPMACCFQCRVSWAPDSKSSSVPRLTYASITSSRSGWSCGRRAYRFSALRLSTRSRQREKSSCILAWLQSMSVLF